MMKTVRGGKRGLALLMTVCMLVTCLPLAIAGAASSPNEIAPSSAKTYVKLTKNVGLFTTETVPESGAIIASSGSVLQMVSTELYTVDDEDYACVYYQNKRYNAQYDDLSGSVMTEAQLLTYITGTLWTAGSYTSLKRELGLTGDVRVHGLQLALKTLGYYSNSLDGNFGEGTEDAVKAFQKAYKLDVDGRAGPITQKLLYPLAITKYGGSSSGGGSGTGTSTGTVKTTASVNLRKSTSTKSARLAVVPKGMTLPYYKTDTVSNITWYYVTYNDLNGWIMGSYTSGGSGGGGSVTPVNPIGTVTITMPNTRVRKTANGSKTGLVLAKGSTVPLLAEPTSAGGYTWYYIQTTSGVRGYVRGDCATPSTGGGGSVTPSSVKTYIRLPSDTKLFTSQTESNTGAVTVSSGTVLQMVNPDTYTVDGKAYCAVYYNNKQYNCVYAGVSAGLLSDTELGNYITGTLWPSKWTVSLKQSLGLVGDVRVHSLQYALTLLGFYTGKLDGTFGADTNTAVRNYQRKNNLTVDGSVGPKTYAKLYPQAIATLSGGGGGGGSTVVADFGTVTSVEKANWSTVDGGTVSLFKKGTTATIMDVATQKVFTIYRWSGGSHADCVPYASSDTKIMCDIAGFTYNSSHPTNDQLAKIKGDTANDNATYTWPDFHGSFGGKNIGSAWDRRPALLNVGGRVFCVSIYGWPHGFNGVDSFAKSKFPNGTLFYAQNNYYGMMCIHFVGSKTHGGSAIDEKHQAAIETAYSFAKSKWPSLVKSGVQ